MSAMHTNVLAAHRLPVRTAAISSPFVLRSRIVEAAK